MPARRRQSITGSAAGREPDRVGEIAEADVDDVAAADACGPWDIGELSPRTTISAGIAGGPAGGRVRLRIGALTAESTRAEIERIGLRRGELARACFSPAYIGT
jgi:hypothetical protein